MTGVDVPAHLLGFVDDDGLVPDRASLPSYASPLVGLRVCHLDDLPGLAGHRGRPLRVVVGGAGGMRQLGHAIEHGLPIVAATARLGDPGDPVGNVRRFLAAARDADLPDELVLHVEVQGPPQGSWLAVADEAAAVEGALVLDLDAGQTAAWIEAALDRELPVVLRGGSAADALDALTTTARSWGDAEDLHAARRWCRSWQTRHVPDAITYLEGLR